MTGDTLWSESRGVPTGSAHAGSHTLGVDGLASGSRLRPTDPASPAAVRPAEVFGPAAGPASSHAPDPSPGAAHPWTRRALPRNDFFQQLLHERRRAERSGSPLSLLRFRLGVAGTPEWLRLEQMLEALQGCKRETDLVGHLDDGEVAVLCPDTGADGSRTLIRKIKAQFEGGPFQAEAATYPHDLFESIAQRVEPLPAIQPFIDLSAAGPEVGYAGKRALDIVLALLAIALLWPLMLLVAMAVAIDSRGPVLFRQERMGRHAVPFIFYKFRSMTVDGDDDIHRRYVSHLIQGAALAQPDAPAVSEPHVGGNPPPLYKLQADPRVTRVGRFIRKTSLDELPQLFNVLRGDMSLVGPRPPLAYEVAQYLPWHLRRILAVKPGITGLWQVEGRSRVSFNDMVRMDLRYIRRCSLRLDLKILLKTFAVVLRCDGAV